MAKQRPSRWDRWEESWLSLYVRSMALLTDAPLSYHEICGLMLLSMASPGARVYGLRGHPRGLRLNLYATLVGESTLSRKSTCLRYMETVFNEVIGEEHVMPAPASSTALLEELSSRPDQASLLLYDEFAGFLEKVTKGSGGMDDIRQKLMEMYDRDNHSYKRASKMSGGKRVADRFDIRGAYLCMMGAATPAFVDPQFIKYMQDGFLPRIIWVWPDLAPERSEAFGTEIGIPNLKQLVAGLQFIRSICRYSTRVAVPIPTREILEGFFSELEEDITAGNMPDGVAAAYGRATAHTVKIAALAALSEIKTPLPRDSTEDAPTVYVTEDHAEYAISAMRSWTLSTVQLVNRIEAARYTDIRSIQEEQDVDITLSAVLALGGMCSRSAVSYLLKLGKKRLDLAQNTLIDRGAIDWVPYQSEGGGRPQLFYKATVTGIEMGQPSRIHELQASRRFSSAAQQSAKALIEAGLVNQRGGVGREEESDEQI